MLTITAIRGGKDAIAYYIGLVRQNQNQQAWEDAQREGRGKADRKKRKRIKVSAKLVVGARIISASETIRL